VDCDHESSQSGLSGVWNAFKITGFIKTVCWLSILFEPKIARLKRDHRPNQITEKTPENMSKQNGL
jgi:hypothetical protein